MIRYVILALALSFPSANNAQTATSHDTYQVAQNRTAQDVVTALEYEGYLIERVSRTLLGRVQITAINDSHLRRVVVSRTTGEILSDVIVTVFDQTADVAPDKPRVNLSGRVSLGVNFD